MKKIPIRQLNPARQELAAVGQFKIRKVEDILQGKDLLHELHRHNFFFILALQQGRGRHEIDFKSYEVCTNSIFFLRPGQVHQLELKTGCKGYLVEFDLKFYHPKDTTAKQRLSKASNKNNCLPGKERFNKMYATLGSMFEEYTVKEEGYGDVIQSSLDIFLIEFIRQSPTPKNKTGISNSYTQERFEEFLEYLNANLIEHKQVSKYAEWMNISAFQLNKITNSSVGKTASEMIDDHIVLEAKRYLLATANQVKEIAGHLGYEDSSYFIRFFKKQTGYSPEAFRANYK